MSDEQYCDNYNLINFAISQLEDAAKGDCKAAGDFIRTVLEHAPRGRIDFDGRDWLLQAFKTAERTIIAIALCRRGPHPSTAAEQFAADAAKAVSALITVWGDLPKADRDPAFLRDIQERARWLQNELYNADLELRLTVTQFERTNRLFG